MMDIEARQVVPVVGPELLIIGEEHGRALTLYGYVARELATRLAVDVSRLSENFDLYEVSSAFLQNPANSSQDLLYETRDLLATGNWPVPEPLRKLAAIRHFDLFVSTTFDGFVERALNETRFGGESRTDVVAYSEKNQVEDIAPGEPPAGRSRVFQLFGRLNAIGDYAITEEKLLEFSGRLQSRDFRPQNLFDLLRSKHLLFLGCSFPGWLARFLLRAIKGDQLFTQGAGGLVADRVSREDRDLVLFLERRKTGLYVDGDAVMFVDELFRRWNEQFGARGADSAAALPDPAASPDAKEDAVFLSYASQDRTVAEQIKSVFDAEGVEVWFDREALQSGDDYRQVIESHIEQCVHFIPVVSRHTAGDEKRFFRLEWSKAIEEARMWPPEFPFIQPIVIDETPLTAPGIPREFTARHCCRLEDVPAMARRAKELIRERRLGKRAR
jgi:hypothetical protein